MRDYRADPLFNRVSSGVIVWLHAMAVVALFNVSAIACPFCSPPGPTLAEEIDGAKAVAIAKFTGKSPNQPTADLPYCRFEIIRVLKGKEAVGESRHIDALHVGNEPVGSRFFVVGNEDDGLVWSEPIGVSAGAEAYVSQLLALPAHGEQRLAFFLPHLQNDEQWLRDDAYDEFAKAPYLDVKALKPKLRRDVLMAGIRDRELAVKFRRLFLTLLGICGADDDLPLLEELICTRDRDLKPSLDAVVACYLTLRGDEGLPLIEREILTRPEVEFIDIYAAVMAIRFHGEEERRIDRARLAQSLRLLINEPQTAELVLADLARWQDWTAIEPLAKLFRKVDAKHGIRVPIVQYLHACPLPAAKEQIALLKEIDPEGVKLGTSPFPLARRPGESRMPAPPKPLRE